MRIEYPLQVHVALCIVIIYHNVAKGMGVGTSVMLVPSLCYLRDGVKSCVRLYTHVKHLYMRGYPLQAHSRCCGIELGIEAPRLIE